MLNSKLLLGTTIMGTQTTLRVALTTLIVAGALTTAACSSMDGGYASNQPISYSNGGKQEPARPPINFAQTRPATGNNVFVFDPQQRAWGAYAPDGQLIRTGIASGGADYCPDLGASCHTPAGTYRVYMVKGEECKSNIFPLGKGGAPMPHCAYFSGGYAVHGSYEVPSYNASHGCVRITPNDAAWLQQQRILAPGTTVVIKPYG